jgi:hypothetical protein
MTNGAIVYELKCGERGSCGTNLSQGIQLYTGAQINSGDLCNSMICEQREGMGLLEYQAMPPLREVDHHDGVSVSVIQ